MHLLYFNYPLQHRSSHSPLLKQTPSNGALTLPRLCRTLIRLSLPSNLLSFINPLYRSLTHPLSNARQGTHPHPDIKHQLGARTRPKAVRPVRQRADLLSCIFIFSPLVPLFSRSPCAFLLAIPSLSSFHLRRSPVCLPPSSSRISIFYSFHFHSTLQFILLSFVSFSPFIRGPLSAGWPFSLKWEACH